MADVDAVLYQLGVDTELRGRGSEGVTHGSGFDGDLLAGFCGS